MLNSVRNNFAKKIISEFFHVLLDQRKSEMPNKVAFHHKGKQIIGWFEIPNGDEQMEDNIFIAEAFVNSKFSNSGFIISSIVVEEEHRFDIPEYYQRLKI